MRLKVKCHIGLQGEQKDEIDVDEYDIKGLTGDALEEKLHEAWFQWACELLDGGFEIMEDMDDDE